MNEAIINLFLIGHFKLDKNIILNLQIFSVKLHRWKTFLGTRFPVPMGLSSSVGHRTMPARQGSSLGLCFRFARAAKNIVLDIIVALYSTSGSGITTRSAEIALTGYSKGPLVVGYYTTHKNKGTLKNYF